MEKYLCDHIGVSSYNIEHFGAPKVNSHDPREEVVAHLTYLKSNCLKRIDNYMKEVIYCKTLPFFLETQQ